jgi:UDP-4-amino-4,6-dideoxy-N-acetyl-beta-L-altrosamine N-acetyltransferase
MNLKNKFNNIIFENIKSSDDENKFKILEIRNEEAIRKNMFNSNLITKIEHKNWLKSIVKTTKKFFYSIKFEDKIVGGLGLNLLDEINSEFDWSFYITQNDKLFGLGSLVELKALDYLFLNYKIKILFCYVLKKNLQVLKLHKKFGFLETNFEKKFLMPKNILPSNVSFLCLNKDQWNIKKKLIYRKLIKS